MQKNVFILLGIFFLILHAPHVANCQETDSLVPPILFVDPEIINQPLPRKIVMPRKSENINSFKPKPIRKTISGKNYEKVMSSEDKHKIYHANITWLDLEKLPKGFWELENIVSLSIYLNKTNKIPPELYNLKNLKNLRIESDYYSIDFPAGAEKLNSLERLYLSSMKIDTIKGDFFSFKNLKHLEVFPGELVSIPEGIENLEKLDSLNINLGKLRKLPEGIGKLTNLKFLYLTVPRSLKTIPDWFHDLKNLEELRIYGNSFSRFPEAEGNFSKLKTLVVECSEIDTFTIFFNQCKNLEILNIHSGKLKKLPSELGELSNLHTLGLWFKEDFPDMPNFKHVKTFWSYGGAIDLNKFNDLSDLSINYMFSKQKIKDFNFLERHPNIDTLRINNMKIENIPESVFKCNQLRLIDFSGNSISSISDNIVQLNALSRIELSKNNFSEVPIVFSKMNNIQSVGLRENNVKMSFQEYKEFKSTIQYHLSIF